jgi:dTDP-4-amino-4,6-dideoxygalactose transaminase
VVEAIKDNNGDAKVIIPVHLFGQPCDMTSIREVAQEHGLKVIEDSCETMFVKHNGVSVGAWGDVGCYSTYVAHILVTGVGGLVTTSNPEYAARMRSLANHGLELDQLNPDGMFYPHPAVGRRFKFAYVGHSFRITEMEAALGLAQMEDIDHIMAARRKNARHWRAGFDIINQNYADPIIMQKETGEHANMMFAFAVRDKNDKEPLIKWLNEREVETRDTLPLINQPIYKWINPDNFPVSKMLVECGLYVGCHQYLDGDDIQYGIQCVEDYFSAKRG